VAILVTLASTGLSAQWFNYQAAGIPRLPDGKPDLRAPAPKLSDGMPDLFGVWKRISPPKLVAANRSDGRPFGLEYFVADGEQIPMTPEAAARFKRRAEVDLWAGRPSERCLPHATPDAMLHSLFQIIPHRTLTTILFEEFNYYRRIHTDGRQLPDDPNPAWFGYSVGRWPGDTLVVDSRGFSTGFEEFGWLDDTGHPYSSALHVIERFRRTDFGHLNLDVTFDDPGAYLRTWNVPLRFELQPETEMIENVCENEKDHQRVLKK